MEQLPLHIKDKRGRVQGLLKAVQEEILYPGKKM